MESSITASFRWTLDEMSRASARATNQQASFRWITYVVSWGASLSMLFAGAYQVHVGRMERDRFLSTLPLCFFFLALPFLVQLLQRFGARHRFRDNPQRDQLVSWDVTADQITISNQLSKTEFSWNAVVRVVAVPDGFLVSSQASLFQWLPLHAFHDSADAQRFANLAKSKVRDYRERS